MHVNLGQGDLKTLIDRIERLERANPLSNSSLGRGQMRFYNGSVLLIENGALRVTGSATISGLLDVSGRAEVSGLLDVTGTANISGILNVSGQTTLSGTTTIAGPTGITGKLTIQGDTSITGKLDISGKTTVKNDLELLSGGILKAGLTKIEPSGKATFGSFIIDPSSDRLIQAPGGWLFSDGSDSIGLASSSTSSVNLNGSYAELNYKGASVVRAEAGLINLNAPKTNVNGHLAVTGEASVAGSTMLNGSVRANALTANTGAANVFRSATGWMYVSSSARRFKEDIAPLDAPDSLLDVELHDWIDKGALERGEEVKRIPGVIAEDVYVAGGEPYVTWNEDGEIQGVDYDRLSFAVTQVLKRQLRDLGLRVGVIESSGA